MTAHFSADGGISWTTRSAANTQTATWSFVVDDEGSNAIRYFASDSSGNPDEAMHSPGFVNIDFTEPTITATSLETTSTQSEAAGWSQDTTGTVTFTAADPVPPSGAETSGLEQISRTVNGGGAVVTTGTATVDYEWVKGAAGVVEGSNEVTYSAKDWAGNSVSMTGFINIDTVAPTTTPSPALASSPTTGWRSTEVTVTLELAGRLVRCAAAGHGLPAGRRPESHRLRESVRGEGGGFDPAGVLVVRPGRQPRGHADRLREHRQERPDRERHDDAGGQRRVVQDRRQGDAGG